MPPEPAKPCVIALIPVVADSCVILPAAFNSFIFATSKSAFLILTALLFLEDKTYINDKTELESSPFKFFITALIPAKESVPNTAPFAIIDKLS
uniref:Uncharacterized protein n=1 Tax=Siphoviridae sp. ctWhx86 TaxID=2826362 RepID=A0A8S5QNJ1_9CAUD|nr:MAG TPA: hypothetical protein [Siphoviridae sp. ctWhx86]